MYYRTHVYICVGKIFAKFSFLYSRYNNNIILRSLPIPTAIKAFHVLFIVYYYFEGKQKKKTFG